MCLCLAHILHIQLLDTAGAPFHTGSSSSILQCTLKLGGAIRACKANFEAACSCYQPFLVFSV